MFLSNLEINTKSNKVLNWISNPYKIHQRLWMGFERQKSGTIVPDFLFRLDDDFKQENILKPRILVLSNIKPEWTNAFSEDSFLSGDPKILNFNENTFIENDRTFRFSLRANPSKKIKDHRSFFKNELEGITDEIEIKRKIETLSNALQKNDWEKVKSKKIGIYKETEQIEWLHRKGNQSGFQIINLQLDKGNKEKIKKKTDGKIIHELDLFYVTFSGILRVTDSESFKRAYSQGIGSGKAFGCGLLLLANI